MKRNRRRLRLGLGHGVEENVVLIARELENGNLRSPLGFAHEVHQRRNEPLDLVVGKSDGDLPLQRNVGPV